MAKPERVGKREQIQQTNNSSHLCGSRHWKSSGRTIYT